jgi:hypothetical protein
MPTVRRGLSTSRPISPSRPTKNPRAGTRRRMIGWTTPARASSPRATAARYEILLLLGRAAPSFSQHRPVQQISTARAKSSALRPLLSHAWRKRWPQDLSPGADELRQRGVHTGEHNRSRRRRESRRDRVRVRRRRGAAYASCRRRLLDRIRRANRGSSAPPAQRARGAAGAGLVEWTKRSSLEPAAAGRCQACSLSSLTEAAPYLQRPRERGDELAPR